jgi:hypothetical protein
MQGEHPGLKVQVMGGEVVHWLRSFASYGRIERLYQ